VYAPISQQVYAQPQQVHAPISQQMYVQPQQMYAPISQQVYAQPQQVHAPIFQQPYAFSNDLSQSISTSNILSNSEKCSIFNNQEINNIERCVKISNGLLLCQMNEMKCYFDRLMSIDKSLLNDLDKDLLYKLKDNRTLGF